MERLYGTQITNCYNKGQIEGVKVRVAGIVGCADSTDITSCYNDGVITTPKSGRATEAVGGLVGQLNSGSNVLYGYSLKTVENNSSTTSYNVGGIVGYSGGSSITCCYSIGNVSTTDKVSNVGGVLRRRCFFKFN